MQSKNILKLHKTHRNVVDLHDSRPILGHEQEVVDLRSPVISGKRESFENALQRKLRGEDVVRRRQVRHVRKINLTALVSKTVAILLLVSLNSFALSQVGNTFSVLNDTETSTGNYQIAGVIDFSLTVSPFSNDAWQNLIQGTSTDRDVDVTPNDVSNPFFYFASSTNFTGDEAFCEAVQVVATLASTTMYDGPLVDLLSPTTTNISAWNFEFSNDDKFFNSVCKFDIDFNGWQTRHDYPKYHDGFSDTEKTSHMLFSDGLKINKVYFEKDEIPGQCGCGYPIYHWIQGDWSEDHCDSDFGDIHYDGDGHDHASTTASTTIVVINDNEATSTTNATSSSNTGGNSASGGGTVTTGDATSSTEVTNTINENIFEYGYGGGTDHEWVELYNPNNEPADIDGWYLCDGQSCDVLNAPEPIPPLGFAIIAGDEAAWELWNIPSDFVKIVVDDGAIGDGLDNENDALQLLRPDFIAFDAVNWGTPDVTWPYFEPTFWNPGVASTTEGSMIARIPTGFDTNQVTDWQTLLPPTVELLYPGHFVNHPWFWEFTYLITWEATNPNGDDEDLLIDIYMIQDTNYNWVADEEDERIPLVMGSPNDGNEPIQVPSGFLGFIWIEVVVTGPENPMTHARDRSGKIYDPFPEYMLDDEEDMDDLKRAVEREVKVRGESQYSYLLTEPAVEDEVGSTTEEERGATREDRRERAPREGENTASSTEEAVAEGATTTIEQVVLEQLTPEENASTTDEQTFAEEIGEMIEGANQETDESPNESDESATSSEEAIIEETDIEPEGTP